MPHHLHDLPSRVISTLFQLEPSLIHLFLVTLQSKSLHQLARDTVYHSITIQDTFPSNSQLDAILHGHRDYGAAVRSINVISPTSDPPCHLPQSCSSLSPSDSSDLIPSNWDSDFFSRLLTKLPNLRTFRWSSDRLPIRGLCTLIGLHSPYLESFSFDIPTRSQPQPPITPPRSNGRPRSQTTNGWHPDSDSELLTARPVRWDADGIEALPATLTHLSISSLSALGAKNLARAFEAITWTALIDLALSKSLFIDDDLMGAIALGSKKIKLLRIQSMSGTKLTERGIEQLFSGLDGLEEIELLDVEGRFSKVGWLKLDDLPPRLKSIKFSYHETGSYHSWTLDHLHNIVSLLALYPQRLERFSVTRSVPLPALLPGRHAMFPELACNNRTAPQKISKDQIMTIVTEAKNLKELNLDWWLISVEGLEVIVRGLPNLLKLTALVDAPFHRIITSTVFVHSKIQTLKVSIPPEHTPLVQELMLVPMIPAYQTLKHDPSSPTASHQFPAQAALSPGSIPTLSSPILTRDLKKFIKRAGHLKEIIWTGRGGLGSWKFIRNGASALNVKVEFLPITEQLPIESFEYQQSNRQPAFPSNSTSLSKHSYHGHQGAGSSPQQNISSGQLWTKNGTSSRSKQRTSSVTTTEDCTNNDSHDHSRRSSSGSLSTSWSSGCHYLSGGYHKRDLEGIPGTPAGETEDENIHGYHQNKDLINGSLINPCHNVVEELLVAGQFGN